MEFEMLQKIIAEVLNVALDEVVLETRFVEDLGADSLDLYQVVMGIEETFGIEITAEQTKDITTVGEAVLLIQNIAQERKDVWNR